MKYFTYLWKIGTWKKKASQTDSPHNMLNHAAGDKFSAAGVSPDCTVFIVTAKEGLLYLGGSIKVGSITDKATAAAQLEVEEDTLSDDGIEYILAKEGTVMPFNANLLVDDSIVKTLEFAKPDGGFVNLKYDSSGKLKGQTLRGVRRLYNGEQKKLLAILKANATAEANS